MVTPKIASSWIACLVIVGCFGNVENQKELTVYVSADEQIAREVFAAFTKKTGIAISWVGDTEASKTTALVQRLLRERDRPIADVFWSSEILGTIGLAKEGVLVPCASTHSRTWPLANRDEEFQWFAFSPRARVIAYDPTKTDRDSLPSTWWEYGEAAMADPRFGTTRTHISVMALFPEKFTAFLESIHSRPFLGGNAATLKQVVDGTVVYAMTDSDDVHAAIARGESVAMYSPSHHDGNAGGTLLIPNTVAIVRGCTRQEIAQEFVDFMLSDQVATLLAESPSHNIPLQKRVASQFPELQVEDPLQIDFYAAAALQEIAIKKLMESQFNAAQ